MRVVSTTLALFVSYLVFAQNVEPPPPPPPPDIKAHKCIYTKRYSDSIRLSFYPFSDYSVVKLVSFRYHADNLPIKKYTIIEDSLVEKVTLSKNDVLKLTDILYNNQAKGKVPPQGSLCMFTPRNGLLFFDSKNQLTESIIVCFHCNEYEKSSERINVGDDCTEKLEKLRKLFVSKGVTFGTNLNIQRYPGETGICCD